MLCRSRMTTRKVTEKMLKAQQESFRSLFGVLDDKYRDLPEVPAERKSLIGCGV